MKVIPYEVNRQRVGDGLPFFVIGNIKTHTINFRTKTKRYYKNFLLYTGRCESRGVANYEIFLGKSPLATHKYYINQ